MKLKKPKKLEYGDTIGILAVSGRIKEYERIEQAKDYFKKCGYKVVISQTCHTSHRYMAGINDDNCVNTLHEFFSDNSINAIVCARGGYGTLRLLNKIDWNLIAGHPKIFAGYSDITTLITAIYKKTGLITFHSAMANGDFSEKLEDYTVQSFFKTLKGEAFEFFAENPVIYNSGIAQGKLWGGNLATLSAMCGTNFVPKTDIILFAEDLNEPAYKIDRMFTQLFNIKDIAKYVKGIALGEFKDVDNVEMLDEIIMELASQHNIPVIRGFKLTHGKVKDTIPVGIEALLDVDKGKLTILEDYTI